MSIQEKTEEWEAVTYDSEFYSIENNEEQFGEAYSENAAHLFAAAQEMQRSLQILLENQRDGLVISGDEIDDAEYALAKSEGKA